MTRPSDSSLILRTPLTRAGGSIAGTGPFLKVCTTGKFRGRKFVDDNDAILGMHSLAMGYLGHAPSRVGRWH